MDILPVPHNPRHPSIEVMLQEVPAPYDNGDYLTYPERRGWGPRSSEEWKKVFELPSRAFQAFLEQWLLLAPLLTWFNCQLDTDKQISFLDLIDHKDNSEFPIFTLRKIEKQIHQYAEPRTTWHTESCFNKSLEMLKDTILLHNCLLNYGKESLGPDDEMSENKKTPSLVNFIHSRPNDPRNEVVVVATELVHNLLLFVVSKTDGEDTLGFNPILSTFKRSPLWRWMLKDNWCPFDLARHFGELPVAGLLFLYNMGPPKPDEKHTIRITSRDTSVQQLENVSGSSGTSLCTPFKCAHSQLTEDDYERKHSEWCQGCEDVVVDPQELHRIIEQGKMPLIYCMEEEDSNDKVILAEGGPGVSYVALSHVWSDGLGNPQRNALPRCQLRRLSNLVRNLPGHQNIILFWCDTLCIPRNSTQASNIKALALGQMRNIYFGASAVLVLDSTLCNFAIEQKSHIEILLKIFSCTWNTRLWTYQEGALAKSLVFQFKDTTYDLEDGFSSLSRQESRIERVCIGTDLVRKYTSLRGFRILQSQPKRLEAAAVALCYRTTSVETDEALCLATLIDLDVTEIARTEPGLRMAKLWKMMPEIPRSIIFNQRSCFSDKGLRWAPRTFLVSRPTLTEEGIPEPPIQLGTDIFGVACRTDLGLRVKYPGLCFYATEPGFRSFFYLRTPECWFYVHFPSERIEKWHYHKYGIITCWDPDKTRLHKGIQLPSKISICVFVGIEDEIWDQGENVYVCHKLGTVIIERTRPPTFVQTLNDMNLDFVGVFRDSSEPTRLMVADAEETHSEQHWQIG